MSDHVIIIAEAGVNHNGCIETAMKLIDVAAEAGVDYVKFQTFKAANLVSKSALKARYQNENDPNVENTQLAMLKRLELSVEDHYKLIDHCRLRGVKFLSTAFDFESMDFLASLGLDLWKIPSGEITNLPYLRRIAKYRGRVILSTGMSTIDDVVAAVEVLTKNGVRREDIILLHCNTQYPTPFEDVNLRAMNSLREIGCGAVGYSDHTLGIETPIAAVAMGAHVIEKHFTLDKSLPGPDHKASLEPKELVAMVSAIRNIEKALGNSKKSITDSERENIVVARKSIIAARSISRGEVFTEDNLTVKRPGNGISPMRWDDVIGKIASRDYAVDDIIDENL